MKAYINILFVKQHTSTKLCDILGTFIPIEDHHLLREEFDECEEGEYVGYEIEDDLAQNGQTFVYAIIMEKVRY